MKSFDEPYDCLHPYRTLFTDEMIHVAVTYWADHLRYGAIDDEKAVNRVKLGGPILERLRPTDPAKIEVFEAKLTEYLRDLQRGEYGCLSTGNVWLKTDYDAQGILYNALKDANIAPMGKLPFKTWMRVETILGPRNEERLTRPHRSDDPLRVQWPMIRGLITVNGAVLYPSDVYECWETPDSLTVLRPLEARRHKTLGILEEEAELVYMLRGTWDEVMTAHHEIQEWEPYRPMV